MTIKQFETVVSELKYTNSLLVEIFTAMSVTNSILLKELTTRTGDGFAKEIYQEEIKKSKMQRQKITLLEKERELIAAEEKYYT